ncbi:sulfatase-like hydrolase/transferase, partial [Planctomycetota bacterium]
MQHTISRRRLLALGAATAAPLCLGLAGAPARETRRRPNFVFILSDDQGWSGLSVPMHNGIAGSKSDFHRTPRLERLAAQGMRFSAAYAPSPVCSPTRISLLTGRSPAQLHWTKAAPVMTAADGYRLVPPPIVRQIADRETTIGEILRRAGYATAHFGKWHLRGGGPGRHGFDVHDGDTGNEDAEPFKD